MNLEEEIICDFKVTSFRKKVWNTQLEMVKLIHKICVENNLKYFAAGGTLLGAIRHNGYIPWDDDIDLMMPRDDYEKFLNIAPKYLDENKFFLQTNKTEKLYFNGHAQIRNNDTTCLLKCSLIDLKNKKNCGVFVDIFPYDYINNNFQIKRIKFLKSLTISKCMEAYGKGLKKIIKKILFTLLCPTKKSIEKRIEKMNKIAMKSKHKDNVGLITFMPGNQKNVWDAKWFDEVILHKFEDMEIFIPSSYDEVLKTEYGDYMQIPSDKGGNIHGECFFDLDNPYVKYIDLDKESFNKLPFGNLD